CICRTSRFNGGSWHIRKDVESGWFFSFRFRWYCCCVIRCQHRNRGCACRDISWWFESRRIKYANGSGDPESTCRCDYSAYYFLCSIKLYHTLGIIENEKGGKVNGRYFECYYTTCIIFLSTAHFHRTRWRVQCKIWRCEYWTRRFNGDGCYYCSRIYFDFRFCFRSMDTMDCHACSHYYMWSVFTHSCTGYRIL